MPRRHDIDALRVLAFALLIPYHTAMAYVAEWNFHLKSPDTAEWLQWPMIAINRWRMPLLFLISGIALGLARPERAPWRMAWQRCVRLLVPLLFGMFVVVAVQAYCESVTRGFVAPGFCRFLWRYWQLQPWPAGSFSGAEFGITWNHLWYLAYLLLYTIMLMTAIALFQPWSRRLDPDRLSKSALTPLLLILPAAWLIFTLLVLMPIYPKTHALFDDWFVHSESLPLFLLGYAIARNQAWWNLTQRYRRANLVVALLALSAELGIRWAGRSLTPGALTPALAALPWYTIERIARGLYTWSALMALLGWGRTLLNRPFRWLPYCTEAVFSWYVLHQSLIIILLYWFAPLRLGPWLEPALVLSGTLAGCLLLHELLIRRCGWLRPLFGLKRTAAGMSAT